MLLNLQVLKMLLKRYYNIKIKWYSELKELNKPSIKIFVGNKIDLRDDSKCDA